MVLHHVKPHGALYVMLHDQDDVAAAVAEAIRDTCPAPLLYWPAPVEMHALPRAARKLGIDVVGEVYFDLAYSDEAHLIVERKKTAKDLADVARRLRRYLAEGVVEAQSGKAIPLSARDDLRPWRRAELGRDREDDPHRAGGRRRRRRGVARAGRRTRGKGQAHDLRRAEIPPARRLLPRGRVRRRGGSLAQLQGARARRRAADGRSPRHHRDHPVVPGAGAALRPLRDRPRGAEAGGGPDPGDGRRRRDAAVAAGRIAALVRRPVVGGAGEALQRQEEHRLRRRVQRHHRRRGDRAPHRHRLLDRLRRLHAGLLLLAAARPDASG